MQEGVGGAAGNSMHLERHMAHRSLRAANLSPLGSFNLGVFGTIDFRDTVGAFRIVINPNFWVTSFIAIVDDDVDRLAGVEIGASTTESDRRKCARCDSS